jgi:hypothetical protein
MTEYTKEDFIYAVETNDSMWFNRYEIIWFKHVPDKNIVVTVEKEIDRINQPYVVCKYSTLTYELNGAREINDFNLNEIFLDHKDYDQIKKQFLVLKIKSPVGKSEFL